MERCLTIASLGLHALIIVIVLFIILVLISFVVDGTVASWILMDRTFNLLDRGLVCSFLLGFLDQKSVYALHFSILILFG